MGDRIKYNIYSFLDFGLSFGGTSAVIVYNYLEKDNSLGFKVTLTGIILVLMLFFTAKSIFERQYRERYDVLLQQLAEATLEEHKTAISEEIQKHKLKNNVYQRLMVLMPFAVLYVVTWLGEISLKNLNGTVGLILACMGAGSLFNVIKKPVGERVRLNRIVRKTEK